MVPGQQSSLFFRVRNLTWVGTGLGLAISRKLSPHDGRAAARLSVYILQEIALWAIGTPGRSSTLCVLAVREIRFHRTPFWFQLCFETRICGGNLNVSSMIAKR